VARFLRRLFVILVLFIVAFALGYVVVDRIVMPRLVGFGNELDVPDVTGMTLGEAKVALEEADLRYNVGEQRYDDVVPVGFVISQDPMPGQKIKEEGLVSLITSLGQEKVIIPMLLDLSHVQAKSLLERLGLRVGRVDTSFSDSIRGGRVVATDPAPDSAVYRGTKVNITLSGAQSLYFVMPDFLGRMFYSVKDSILALGLELGEVTFLETNDSRKGVILLQSPPAGMTVKRGDKVILRITSGTE